MPESPRLHQSHKTGLFARWLQGAFVPPSCKYATGRRIWVGNAEVNAGTGRPYGRSPWVPLTTLQEAFTLTLDAQKDVIFVMPGHAEDVTAADIATTNDGVSVIGLGKGADRPTFTMTAVGSTFHVNSANIHIQNLVFVVGDNATTAVITVEADDFTMKDCVLREGVEQAVSYIAVAGAANVCDRMTFDGVRIESLTAGSTQGFLLNTVENDLIMKNCYIHGDFTAAAVQSNAALFRVFIKDNMVANIAAGVHAIEFSGGASGAIVGNMVYSSTMANGLDPGACWCSRNFGVDSINAAGVPIPLEAAGGYPTDYVAATTFAADSITAAEIANDALGATEIADDAFDAATYAADVAEWRLAISTWVWDGEAGPASYDRFTVTGDVLVRIFGICTEAVVGANNMSLGVAAGAELIVATAGNLIILDEIWHDVTPTLTTEVMDIGSTHIACISNGADIQLTIAGGAQTDGTIVFHCHWLPLSADGNVVGI